MSRHVLWRFMFLFWRKIDQWERSRFARFLHFYNIAFPIVVITFVYEPTQHCPKYVWWLRFKWNQLTILNETRLIRV